MRFTILLYVLLMSIAAPTPGSAEGSQVRDALASIDLMTREGTTLVDGKWRFTDVELVRTVHRASDANGQPTGASVDTWDYRPHAGARDFDDSSWPTLAPDSLRERRGQGRISFVWYRIAVTIPERIGAFDPSGTDVYLETALDDYAEIWVDGELPRRAGQTGGSVVAGWNATNRVLIARNVRPGRKIQLAIFGMNGPISDPPTNFIWMHDARLSFEPGTAVPLAVPPHEVNVRVLRNGPALEAIVPANPKLYKLAEGFVFTEGPVWNAKTRSLLFSDPNSNRIYAYDEAKHSLSLYSAQSGYDGADIAEYGQPGSNGLALDRSGRLTINQHGHRRVVRIEHDGGQTVLADRYEGKRLNSPNDLVYRSDGSLYFTDPPFGLPKFDVDPRKELPFSGVYRSDEGRITLLAQDLKGPNGIAFSPAEEFLYVANWDPQHKVVLRYPVKRDGTLAEPQIFIDITREVPGDEALDGIKVDSLGNLYLAAPDGLRIYSSEGQHLGSIVAPRPIHNFAWGGAKGSTLYLTARDRLYRIELLVPGART